jgi:hypothetical protein
MSHPSEVTSTLLWSPPIEQFPRERACSYSLIPTHATLSRLDTPTHQVQTAAPRPRVDIPIRNDRTSLLPVSHRMR